MNTWEAITGAIILVIGITVFWQNYNTVTQCNTIGGKISTAITSIFGGTGAQACYNSTILEIGSIITAIIGAVIVYAAIIKKPRR